MIIKWRLLRDQLQDQIKNYFDEDQEKDVILVCDDGKVVAHKVVLSVCSPVFKNILIESSCSEGNTILLPGINQDAVTLLLQFLYAGEVAVSQQEMMNIIELGKIFQIEKLLSFDGVEVTDKDDGAVEMNIKHEDVKKSNINPLKFCTTVPLTPPKAPKENFEGLAEMVKDHSTPPSPRPLLVYNQDELECPKCLKKFANPQNKIYHMTHVHDGTKYPCTNCDKKFASKQMMRKHRSKAHSLGMTIEETSPPPPAVNDDDLRCPKCDKKFANSQNRRYHMIHVHEGRNYPCTNCDREFSSNQNMLKHISTVHNLENIREDKWPNIFTCKECNQDFSNIRFHTRHMTEVHKSNDLLLEKDENVLMKVKQENDNSEGLVACPDCDKLFSLKQNMRAHQRTVHANRKFSCTECDAQYSSAQNLRLHITGWHQ